MSLTTTPRHYMNVYQKPAQGDDFLERLELTGYTHTLSSHGSDMTMKANVMVTEERAEAMYERYVGNRIAVYVDNPFEPIFEGILTRAIFASRSAQFTRAMDEMGNRVVVRYEKRVGTARDSVRTSPEENTDSQAIYGVKQFTLLGPFKFSNSTSMPDALADLYAAKVAYPINSVIRSRPAGSFLTIEAVGIIQTLEWELIEFSNTDVSITTGMQTAFTNLNNGDTFFDNTDYDLITANALTNTYHPDGNKTVLAAITEDAESGDGIVRYTFGMTRTPPFGGARRFYYREAVEDVIYSTRDDSGLRVFSQTGKSVRPWAWRPDGVVRIQDVFIGWLGAGDDPRETYLKDITYDGDSQSVTWNAEDSGGFAGILNANRINKRIGHPISENARRNWFVEGTTVS